MDSQVNRETINENQSERGRPTDFYFDFLSLTFPPLWMYSLTQVSTSPDICTPLAAAQALN